jgi:four helix bundle suffix protein
MKEKNDNSQNFIPKHGGYRNLLSFQRAEIIYDGTQYFVSRFYRKPDRTIDQMVQAARSGKQNIAEGCMNSATSKEMEIKLINVAKSSLEELKLDYEDFLRTRKLPIWDIKYRLVSRFREINKTPNANYHTFEKAIENENPEICANIMICLINITTYLLAKQIITLEKDFLENGGLRERMTAARIENRNKKKQ